MSDHIEKIDGLEKASLAIVLQSYKYLLQDDEIMGKLGLSKLQREILFDSINDVIENVLPKMTKNY